MKGNMSHESSCAWYGSCTGGMPGYENTAFLKKAAFISVGLLIIPGLFNSQNCGIHQSGFTVLCFRNDGSESPGILTIPHRNIPLFFVYEKRMDIFIMRGILRLVLK